MSGENEMEMLHTIGWFLFLGGFFGFGVFFVRIYDSWQINKIERWKRKHAIDDCIESHFGCSRENWYKSLKKK